MKKKLKSNERIYSFCEYKRTFLKSYRLFSLLKTYSLIPGLKDNIRKSRKIKRRKKSIGFVNKFLLFVG